MDSLCKSGAWNPTKFKLMPQFLKDLGYSTHGIGKWHLGFCHPDYLPSNRGFDTHLGFWNGAGKVFDHTLTSDPRDQTTVGFDYHMNEDIDFSTVGKSTSKIIGDRVNEIVRDHASGNTSSPFLFMLPLRILIGLSKWKKSTLICILMNKIPKGKLSWV